MNKAVIYARVSSTGERQDTERQLHDLRQYAMGVGLDVVRVFEEKASGAKVDRPVLEVVEDLTAAGVNIYFQDHRMNTLKEDGTPDPLTKMLISMLGSFAEMERKQIAYRLNSGRQRAIENGVKMGRKEGYRLKDEEIIAKYPEVARRLRKGLSIRDAAGACGVSVSTVQKVKKAMK